MQFIGSDGMPYMLGALVFTLENQIVAITLSAVRV